MSLPLAQLIQSRMKELGIRSGALAARLGYLNLSKGARRIDELCGGDLAGKEWLLANLPRALSLPDEVAKAAVDETRKELERAREADRQRAEAAWRAAFKPHAYLLGTNVRPSSITFFGITGGAERWLVIPLDHSQPPLSYAAQALAVVRRTPVVQFFGATTGFIVNYTPDHAVRFDLQGKPVETFTRAYRPMEVTLTLGRREMSAERFGQIFGTIRKDDDSTPPS
jgi:hypothetical protein